MGTIAQCRDGLRTSGSNSNNEKQALQNAMADPRISKGQPSRSFVCVKNPLVLQRIAAVMTKTMPLVFEPVLAERIGSAVFSALTKVNGSCRSKIGCNSQQICTNDSLLAKGEGRSTSSLALQQPAPCD